MEKLFYGFSGKVERGSGVGGLTQDEDRDFMLDYDEESGVTGGLFKEVLEDLKAG